MGAQYENGLKNLLLVTISEHFQEHNLLTFVFFLKCVHKPFEFILNYRNVIFYLHYPITLITYIIIIFIKFAMQSQERPITIGGRQNIVNNLVQIIWFLVLVLNLFIRDKLPMFCSNNTVVCNYALFKLKTNLKFILITSDATQCCLVVFALPSEVCDMVIDIQKSPPVSNKYERLKKSITLRILLSEQS